MNPLDEAEILRRMYRYILILITVALVAATASAQAPAVAKIPVVLDTDIGTDVDDAFALALMLASPELDLRGVTTCGSDPQIRALMLCRFLTMTGRRHTPVAAGGDPQPKRPIGGQYQYYYHPDVIFNRTTRPVKESAVDFLYARLKAQPGKITIVATGPLTNIARLIEQKPDCKRLIKQIVWSGGSRSTDNLAADPQAAKIVFRAGIPFVPISPDVTENVKLNARQLQRVFAPHTALTLQIQALHQLCDKTDALADLVAVALCIRRDFCKLVEHPPNIRIPDALDTARFLKWYVDRMASCVAPAKKPASLVAQGSFPHRVHVAEDYDSDIERRWWMAGKAETKNLPPGSRRACRGVLTHDFDDLLGNARAMYTAVIFNPVPGPPMGKNTRLSFRYWLKGTDTLRVQIYSLTNGYHRHLVLTKLPQGAWQSATVDMTVARRPDGTGGPLSEGERIDDIQFYTDPAAELIIDDIVLYDAADPGEKRPFPKRVLFTAWFDSGKQGKEWPGAFEIVPQKGYFWHAAKSVPQPAPKLPGIRLGLRGERTVGAVTQLTFRYRVTSADTMRIGLVNTTANATQFVALKGLAQGKWAEATVNFAEARAGDRVSAITWQLPTACAELLIDDVLLYEQER